MRSHSSPLLKQALALGLFVFVGACGVGKNQSPVSTDEATGTTSPVQIEEEKAGEYVTKAGDTLRGIAGRNEIYDDPDLWPLLLDANVDALGVQQGKSKLEGGIRLVVPRGVDEDSLSDAREKARQATASSKQAKPRPVAPKLKATAVVTQAKASKPAPVVKKPESKPAVKAKAESADAMPVPKAKKSSGLLPVLFFLLLLLAALAAVLFYFTRRDQKDGDN